jgi:hypothetical protein
MAAAVDKNDPIRRMHERPRLQGTVARIRKPAVQKQHRRAGTELVIERRMPSDINGDCPAVIQINDFHFRVWRGQSNERTSLCVRSGRSNNRPSIVGKQEHHCCASLLQQTKDRRGIERQHMAFAACRAPKVASPHPAVCDSGIGLRQTSASSTPTALA